uniref:Uncharacterized protein n=1 Tax=Arundo donax TaxID=35708 RepID=A0A0A9GZD3_ARUDO
MDTQATQEFLAELKVLTHVHHLNLVGDLLIFLTKSIFESNCCYQLTVLLFCIFLRKSTIKLIRV